jgi:hypothetical protein
MWPPMPCQRPGSRRMEREHHRRIGNRGSVPNGIKITVSRFNTTGYEFPEETRRFQRLFVAGANLGKLAHLHGTRPEAGAGRPPREAGLHRNVFSSKDLRYLNAVG